ncbi:MAG TPA: YggT family protein [Candidatus Dormibacteraeota bacterium]|jgi:YggT family protein
MLIATLLIYVLYAFIIVMLVRVAFSWVSPYPTNSVSRFTWRVTEPVLAPVRRWLPAVSGMDLSPLVVTLVAYFLIAALRNIG